MNNIKGAVRRSRQSAVWFHSKRRIPRAICEACECDPCDCGWGNYLKVEKKKNTF